MSNYSNANMGTKAYAALLSIARGGIYGHTAMLLAGESSLADIVLQTPIGAYSKADRVAKRRGEAVDPSRSGAAGWDDSAASVLLRFLIGYGEIDPQLLSGAGEVSLKFRPVEKRGKRGRVERGFQVFRTFGNVEAFVGELWIGNAARFKISEEVLRLFVEEARRTAPDLSGFKKIWQTLEWLNTDVSFTGRQVVGDTVCLWQLRWYIALFGEGGQAEAGPASQKRASS